MELTCEIKKKIVKVKSVQCRQHHMAQNLWKDWVFWNGTNGSKSVDKTWMILKFITPSKQHRSGKNIQRVLFVFCPEKATDPTSLTM